MRPLNLHDAPPSLADFKARFTANASLTDDQLRERQRQRTAHKVILKRLRREDRPAPRLTRQFVAAKSCTITRDRRLVPLCAKLVDLLIAQAGRGVVARITRTYLMRELDGVSKRHVARMLADLRKLGYIKTTHRIAANGATLGLDVELLDPLLPYWATEVPVLVVEGGGDLRVTPLITQESKSLSSSLPPSLYPQRRPARGLQDGAA